jgi:SAM-dependent methyltransferase
VAPKDDSTRPSAWYARENGANRYLLVVVAAAFALGAAGVVLYVVGSDRPWVQAWIPGIAGAFIVGALTVLVLEIVVKTVVADEQQHQLKPLREAADREIFEIRQKVDRFLEGWQYVIGELRGDYPEVVRREDGGSFPESLVSRLPIHTYDLLWSGWGQPNHDKVLAEGEWRKAVNIASQIKRQSDRIVEWYSRALDPPIPAALGQIQEYLLTVVENMPRTGQTDWFHEQSVHRDFLVAYRTIWPDDDPALEAAREEVRGIWLAIWQGLHAAASELPEEHDRSYEHPPLVGLYDALNPSGPREDCYLELMKSARAMLDLGCGTGRLLKRAAKVHERRMFVGVDPVLIGVDRASSMLAEAQRADHEMSWEESLIVWQWGDVRTVDVGRRFDLITMTGYAFQELLTDGDIRMLFSNVLRHLDPGGQFAFDLRRRSDEPLERLAPSPAAIRVATPSGESVDVVRVPERAIDPDLVEFATTYTFAASSTPLVSRSVLRFIDLDRLRALLEDVGFRIDRWFGDCDRTSLARSGGEDVVVATRIG